jgi:HK97 family phage major capsid protein
MLEVKSESLCAVFDAAETIARPALEAKAATIAAPGKGGLAVPQEIDAVIGRVLAAASPIRAIAQVVDVGSAN